MLMIEYAEREEGKREGWGILSDESNSMYLRAHGLLLVVEMHYWRCLEALNESPVSIRRRIYGKRYSKYYQLCIDRYTEHWLYANGSRVSERDVVKYVCDEIGYKPVKSKFLPYGHTVYVLPGDPRL